MIDLSSLLRARAGLQSRSRSNALEASAALRQVCADARAAEAALPRQTLLSVVPRR